jgi:transposase-like protein
MKYSIGFRTSVLRKVLPPESKSLYQVAREAGISAITIQSWLSQAERRYTGDSGGRKRTDSEPARSGREVQTPDAREAIAGRAAGRMAQAKRVA